MGAGPSDGRAVPACVASPLLLVAKALAFAIAFFFAAALACWEGGLRAVGFTLGASVADPKLPRIAAKLEGWLKALERLAATWWLKAKGLLPQEN